MAIPESKPIFPTPFELHDLLPVQELIGRCYREHGLVLNLHDECEQHLLSPGEYFRSHGGEFWVVRDESGLVIATGALDVHAGPAAPIAELKSMYVDPSYRRRGLGRALTLHVMNAARVAGCAVIELWSDTRFEAAHRMYESLGFQRMGRRDVADSNNSAEWGYRRAL